MSTRKLAIWGVTAAALLAASAATAQDTALASVEPCAEPGALTMWVWDENWAAVIGDAITEWTTDVCPGATVDLQVQPWAQYWDLLRTNVAGGEVPDVFNMSQDRFRFYAENEALLNLDPYIDAAEVDLSGYGTGMIEPYRYGDEGNLYAMPVNWDTIAVYYNRDMFDAAGIAYPTDEWDWNDFAEIARALTDPEAGVYGAAPYSEYQAGYASWISSTGTSPLVTSDRSECTLTSEGSLAALNFLVGLYNEGVAPSLSTMGGTSADDAFNFWLAQRVAMVTGGSWKLPTAFEQATFNWDVVRLPRYPETGVSRSQLHSVGYVASAQTENPDLAANFILFLASPAGQVYFAEGGGVAPANAAVQDVWLETFADTGINVQAFVDAIDASQGVTLFDAISSYASTELPVMLFDLGVPVEEATQQACEFIMAQIPS